MPYGGHLLTCRVNNRSVAVSGAHLQEAYEQAPVVVRVAPHHGRALVRVRPRARLVPRPCEVLAERDVAVAVVLYELGPVDNDVSTIGLVCAMRGPSIDVSCQQ